MRPSHYRGSALLIAMIAMAVLALLVAGAISFSGANRQAAAASNKADATAACADTARRHLLARLRTYNIDVEALQFQQALPDAKADPDKSQILTGHFRDVGAQATVVKVKSEQFSGASRQVRDMANMTSSGSLGGNYYRVVVKCQQPGNREAELEFVFRHGI